MFNFWKRVPLFYKLSSDFKQRTRALNLLHSETKKVIKMRRLQFDSQTDASSSNSEMDDDLVFGAKRRVAFLDSLLMTQRETGCLTDINIENEVDTFMFAVRKYS